MVCDHLSLQRATYSLFLTLSSLTMMELQTHDHENKHVLISWGVTCTDPAYLSTVRLQLDWQYLPVLESSYIKLALK